jgi:hypothetical protein
MKNFALFIFIVSLGGAGPAAWGAITTFSSRTSFEIAIAPTPFTVEDFTPNFHFPISSGILNSATTDAGLSPGDIKPGVTYSTPIGTGNFFNIDAGNVYSGGFLDSIDFNDPNRALTVTFDNSVSAFGFDTNELMGSFEIQIHLSSGPDHVASFPSPSLALVFFGFVSDSVNIESVTIRGDDSTFAFALDNFTFTNDIVAPAVPEPASFTLWGLGALGCAIAGYRRRNSAA